MHSPTSSFEELSPQQPPTALDQRAAIHKKSSLAQISVPSFSAFRLQASSIPILSPTQRNRGGPSPRAASFSLAERTISPRIVDLDKTRPLSLDSPLPQQPSGIASALSPPLTEEDFVPRQEERSRSSDAFPPFAHDRAASIDSRLRGPQPTSPRRSNRPQSSRPSSIPVRPRYRRDLTTFHTAKQSVSSTASSDLYDQYVSSEQGGSRNSMLEAHSTTPIMTLQHDGPPQSLTDESAPAIESPSGAKRPKSPSRLGSFFGWKSASQESPTTTFSDRSLSPLPSPRLARPKHQDGSVSTARLTPPVLDVHKANMNSPDYFDNPGTPLLLGSPGTNAHVEELERELREVSSELAGSIKREMELEDEVERFKSEIPPMPTDGLARRSSDYFSDSGASSTRYPIGDPEAKIEQVERMRRKAEQEKAQFRVDFAQRLQNELRRRRDLEALVQSLEEQLQKRLDEEEERYDEDEHVRELEASLDDTRRRLSQERQAKDQFEDMFGALRHELEKHRNERDNLRDEVVPQLHARIEGLEAETTDTKSLIYENTRMQQELQALREAQHASVEASNPRFGSIAEENDTVSSPSGPKVGLTRSSSLARSSSLTHGKRGSLARSNSVKDRSADTRQRSDSASAERLKDIEDQRDALHKALRLLISRHNRQQREHERAMKKITSARDQALESSPKRTAFHREVSHLKDEVTTLRQRADDALEQKWQYEKGLGGLKMDLDRAEQETKGLRIMLQEHDIFAPSPRTLVGGSQNDADRVVAGDATLEDLKSSISSAEAQRDSARLEADVYRQRALSLQEAEEDSDEETEVVSQLFDSANRMDELAEQLELQVQSNMSLRSRLAEAVAKGEREQRESTRQIEEMQLRLASMESGVLAAQQHSETLLGNHETDVKKMEEASSPHLQRLMINIPEPSKLSPSSPLFASRSPKLGTPHGSSRNLIEQGRTQMLERKVKDLEGALAEAEGDMQLVVRRINTSQYAVAELQAERDAAFTQMRKLQAEILAEREKAEALMT